MSEERDKGNPESDGTTFPGGRVLGRKACEQVFPDRSLHRVSDARRRDVTFLLDRLTGDRPARRHSRLTDARHIGMAGHSIGGASAATAADPRVAAGVNMDGTFFAPLPEAGLGGRPFLLLGGDPALLPPDPEDTSWADAWPRTDGWKRWLTVTGMSHPGFTDWPASGRTARPSRPSVRRSAAGTRARRRGHGPRQRPRARTRRGFRSRVRYRCSCVFSRVCRTLAEQTLDDVLPGLPMGVPRGEFGPAVRERGRTGEGFGRQGGETAARTGVVVALVGVGTLCGQFLASFCLGRCDRFRFLAPASVLSGLAFRAAAVVGTGYAGLSAPVCLLGVCLGGSMGSLQAVGALAYPATLRATGIGRMSGIGRIGTLVSGLFGGIMIGAGWEIPRILFVLCVPPALTGVAALLLRGVLSRTAPPLPDR
ncbi:hypothetical protein [Streptomyces lavendulae]|uniref:hypothetical protein n=1 Tax=Streptomyces lavendulae TaxID=1914 RepID=UPI0024A4A2F4|nr:hypothetical protein [Streptomyces lavendulae]GLV96828.1 hypothetical protein Slala05_04600 [Streptomyces lavendulae subsp. lavendulae]